MFHIEQIQLCPFGAQESREDPMGGFMHNLFDAYSDECNSKGVDCKCCFVHSPLPSSQVDIYSGFSISSAWVVKLSG